jgi:hypothetical protein
MDCQFDTVTITFIRRTETDRIGTEVRYHYCEDHLLHEIPYRMPIYDDAGVFVGECVADSGVWKAVGADGDESHICTWDRTLRGAIINLGLMNGGELHDPILRGRCAYGHG